MFSPRFRLLTDDHSRVMRESERAAELLGVTAPIRIDVRRYRDAPDSNFALFDVNMKPVSCQPSRCE